MRPYRTHYRPAGRGKTACGIKAKRSRHDSQHAGKVTCKTCRVTVAAWIKRVKDWGLR